ncbi:MAG TPA: S8 family serine peptidase [Gammaproteobacteria bacterium]|nr:S8 family serine peptidase [Gammaproteobacteria bacterium]
MQREYVVRGKHVTLEELEGVVAIMPVARGRAAEEVARDFGRMAKAPADVDENEWRAFATAGWVLVRPSAEVSRALEARAAVDGAEAVQRVFRHPSGRILLDTGRLSIRLRATLSEDQARAALEAADLDVVNRLKFAPNLFEVRVRPGRDALQASLELAGQGDFEYAEPQFIEHIPERFTPTDPEYGQQWHLNNTGQGGGTAGADISAEDAWDMTRGTGARIAVVDNGFDVNHEDLTAAVQATSGFFQMDGGGNATFVQGLAGYPGGWHGTFCAGLALARANNGLGVSGVAPEADFVAVACLGDQVGTQATLARALAYAADPSQEVAGANPADGADVISCSLGPNGADWEMMQTLQDAIDFTVTNGRGGLGTPIFWAVTNGNFQIQFDEVCAYGNTIAVGRSTRNDLEDNCGFGPELDFLATGVDVRSTEPGDNYGNSTGTSFAAPVAAGVGGLLLTVNPDLTWQQLRQAMRDTCDKIGGNIYDANGHNNDYGFGRVNAERAVCNGGRVVDLLTPAVTFNDVPEGELTARAVVFSVISCQAATFQIVAGPAVTSGPGSFGTLPSPNAALPATTGLSSREARLWLSFTGTSDGDVAAGEVTVRLVQTGQEWVIPITANTIARPTVATVLVLDQSGSMQWASGLPGFTTRNEVLKFAAPVFVNVLQEGNGLGIVAFDHDAHDRMTVQTLGPPSAFDPVRATALGVIAAHTPNPAGNTAIGDGVENASNLLAATSGFDHQAMVVFTDGHETAAKYIADVAPLINERVFAIGLGTADQIQPAALTALTNGTGGYLLLTGVLGPDDLFRLSKYYLQILAGVTNWDIVLDPEGALKPGQKHRIPFHLNEADIGVDAILLGETNLPVFQFALETPAGDLITPGVATGLSGMDYITAQGVSFYRATLPVPIGAGARTGKWHAVLTVDDQYYKRYLSTLDQYPEWYQKVLAHGVRYSLTVQSYSGIRLQAQLVQGSNEPGATLTVRAVLTEYGLPIPGSRATVRAEFERPDGTTGLLLLAETGAGSGIYSAVTTALLAGVYPFRVLAAGTSMRGRTFTREHLLTGAVWKGGDQPPPTTQDDPRDEHDRLCRFLGCLLGRQVLGPRLEQQLKELGIDVDALRRCLALWCRRPGGLQAIRPAGLLAGAPGPAADHPTLTPEAVKLLRELLRELDETAGV